MRLFHQKQSKSGLLDVIQSREPDYLVWKWYPGTKENGHAGRGNAIRCGSKLYVRSDEVAIFQNESEIGIQQEFIEGPYDGVITTGNLPVLSKIVETICGEAVLKRAEVYFVNCRRLLLRFAVPYFEVYDPALFGEGIPVAVRGNIKVQIQDYNEFILKHGLNNFTMSDLQLQTRAFIGKQVKDAMAEIMEIQEIPVELLANSGDTIKSITEPKIANVFEKEYGLAVENLEITAVDFDKTSEGYQKLRYFMTLKT